MDNLYDFDLLQTNTNDDDDVLTAFNEFIEGALEAQRTPNLPQPPIPSQNHPSRQQNIPQMPQRPPQNNAPHHQPMHPPQFIPQHPPLHFDQRRRPAPNAFPPRHIPNRVPGFKAINPGGIVRCMDNNTYIWLVSGQNFWFYPTFVGRRSIAGYRFVRNNWVYMGFDINLIESFFCGGR
ncbi:MAG: hypothetical protein FWE44_06110 [Defluviitaleaceae bacterium]|nr:hypothetical protein [Defluviitaleaceae bacterium]